MAAPALGAAFRVDVQLQGPGLELDCPEDDGAVAHGRHVAEGLALSRCTLLRRGVLWRQPVPEGRRGCIKVGRLIEGCSNLLLRHAVLQPVDEGDEFHLLAVAVGQLWELGVQHAVEKVDQKECGEQGRGEPGEARMSLVADVIRRLTSGSLMSRPSSSKKAGAFLAIRFFVPAIASIIFSRKLMLEGQQAAAEISLAAHLDDAHGEPVPGLDRLGRGVLDHADRLAATQQVAGEEGLAGLDVAHLVEAHRRGSERRHVGAVDGVLLPAAALEIVVDDVAGVRPPLW